jgi:SAM-dependent methyltransferase
MTTDFDFACPICHAPLETITPDALRCASDAAVFPRVDGIWRLMRPDRIAHFARFVKEYEAIRQAEGRGSDNPSYYRALPFADLTGRMPRDWQIRAASYRALESNVIASGRSLKILDLGAGNGWLAYRFAKRGHTVAAVDLLTNGRDGLGAHVHYDASFTPVQAEFDHLPFAANQFDAVIFNSSFHYSADYAVTLNAAWRVAKPNGGVVILDSPIYTRAASGTAMVREREEQFQHTYGFPSNSLGSENFLTFQRLDELAALTKTHWRFVTPWYGWRWALRPWLARVRGQREPARFVLIIGTRAAGESN